MNCLTTIMRNGRNSISGINYFEGDLADAVYHWSNYVRACGNVDVLEEKSIRYPLAEYLERKHNADVELEAKYDEFPGKRMVDFKYEIPSEDNQPPFKKGLIEVKYLSKYFKYDKEIQRVFNDIVRLAIGDGSDNLFVMFGDSLLFETAIKRSDLKFKEAVKVRDGSKGESPASGIYSYWFSFKPNGKMTFNVDEFPYQRDIFIESYHKNIQGYKLETELMARRPISKEKSPIIVYIWKVKRL